MASSRYFTGRQTKLLQGNPCEQGSRHDRLQDFTASCMAHDGRCYRKLIPKNHQLVLDIARHVSAHKNRQAVNLVVKSGTATSGAYGCSGSVESHTGLDSKRSTITLLSHHARSYLNGAFRSHVSHTTAVELDSIQGLRFSHCPRYRRLGHAAILQDKTFSRHWWSLGGCFVRFDS